jgi:Mn-containing catalase
MITYDYEFWGRDTRVTRMFLRVDKLQAELPAPKRKDPNAAAALQELLGGKYGEMSTLGNYMFQSFNFRSKSKLRPFYSSSPALPRRSWATSSWSAMVLPCSTMVPTMMVMPAMAATAAPVNSNGTSWNNDFVTTTGNVVMDLLHNFHLECGARLHKLRVYETLSEPTGREVCGYLLVRGSVHAHAYAVALKQITGVAIEKMLPTPNINLDKIPECQKYLEEGSHRRLYTFSPTDYREISGIWGNGEQALPGDPPGALVTVEDGMPEGGKIHQLTGVPSAFTPDYAPEEMFEIATKLYQASR